MEPAYRRQALILRIKRVKTDDIPIATGNRI